VGPVRDLLERKGYVPLGAVEIRMPSNYRRKVEGPTGKERMLIEAGEERARAFAGELLEGRAVWRGFPLGGPIHWLSVRPGLWRRIGGSAANAWVADPKTCTRCGLCVSLCPTGNIRLEEGGPKVPESGLGGIRSRPGALPSWGKRCGMCQRCFAYCPVGAVSVPGRSWGRYRPVGAGPAVGVEETFGN
jgi:ferredoxin